MSSVAASGVGAAEQAIQRRHCRCPNSDNDCDPSSSLLCPNNCSVSHTDFFSHEVWKHVMLATVTASLASVSCCLAAAKGRSRVLAMLLLVARPPRRPDWHKSCALEQQERNEGKRANSWHRSKAACRHLRDGIGRSRGRASLPGAGAADPGSSLLWRGAQLDRPRSLYFVVFISQ